MGRRRASCFSGDDSGSMRPGWRAHVDRRLWSGRSARPPTLEARRSRARNRRPDPRCTIGVVRHGPRSLHQLAGGESIPSENHPTRRVAHQAVERGVIRQTLELDHRANERRIIYRRGRHPRAVTGSTGDDDGGKHDCKSACDHWQQRYLVAAGHVNRGPNGPILRAMSGAGTATVRRQGCAAGLRRPRNRIGGYPMSGQPSREPGALWITC